MCIVYTWPLAAALSRSALVSLFLSRVWLVAVAPLACGCSRLSRSCLSRLPLLYFRSLLPLPLSHIVLLSLSPCYTLSQRLSERTRVSTNGTRTDVSSTRTHVRSTHGSKPWLAVQGSVSFCKGGIRIHSKACERRHTGQGLGGHVTRARAHIGQTSVNVYVRD